MLIRIQPCNTCSSKQYEPLDLEYAPAHVGNFYCYYTDRCINQYVEEGTFAPSCPLFVNEEHKQ